MMPVIREVKKEYSEQLQLGVCSKVGDEIWYLQGKLLRIGVIIKVNEAGQSIELETKDGRVILKPEESLLFKKPEKPRKKK